MNQTFDNHAPATGTATLLCIFPSSLKVFLAADQALAFTRRTHYRFNNARVTYVAHGLKEGAICVGKAVTGRG
ncbi:hypothetical [Yersinia pestis KIM10+]|uniref:Uncharacterized protein n=1 Tax=Yersinia pestis TaxID=632 RepID=Q8CL01_YERPE|nr:hypothetical [Yersinia pestis KIM10+]